MIPSTEQDSLYPNLSSLTIKEIITAINSEDKKVATAVQEEINSISKLVEKLVQNMENGGRLFYIGAGTSGRLGILDASECPPTYGVPQGLVIGIIAGGDTAIRKAVEFAEDDSEQAILDLLDYNVCEKDFAFSYSNPVCSATIRVPRSISLWLDNCMFTILLPSTFPSFTIAVLVIMFKTIFWAVPDFILVLPVIISGPTSTSIGK